LATPGAESAVYDCLVESCSQSPSCRRRVVSCLSLSRPGLAQQQNAAHIKLLLLLDDDATPRRDALRHVAGPCGAARQAGSVRAWRANTTQRVQSVYVLLDASCCFSRTFLFCTKVCRKSTISMFTRMTRSALILSGERGLRRSWLRPGWLYSASYNK